jgi:hypothetical protein
VADYEIYIWEVGKPYEDAVRLTYHSANDRWPDIFIPAAATAQTAAEAAAASTNAQPADATPAKAEVAAPAKKGRAKKRSL